MSFIFKTYFIGNLEIVNCNVELSAGLVIFVTSFKHKNIFFFRYINSLKNYQFKKNNFNNEKFLSKIKTQNFIKTDFPIILSNHDYDKICTQNFKLTNPLLSPTLSNNTTQRQPN